MDRQLIRRVLVNLLHNAAKFTPGGGKVTVTASIRDEPRELWLSVADTGPGIPEAHREMIFDKFAQASHRAAAEYPSTGLGLTFCKLVAEAHGGRIWVESEEGKGSTFTLALPR